MRLERTVLHKVGPFDHLELDLSNVPGPLVAIVAPNGTGKSFLLETSFLGACYRRTETQGTPLARAWARDSYIESTFVNGTRQTFRHLLDGIGKKGEAIALGADDVTPLWADSVSVRTFDAWAEKHLPDPDVVKATTFAVQRSEGFIGLGSAERIQVILEAIGVARIERTAQLARKEESRVEAEIKALAVRIADAKAGAPDVAAAEEHASEYRDAATLAETRSTNMRAALAEAEAAASRRAELARAASSARETRERLERDLEIASRRLHELKARHAAADPQAARAAADEAERVLVAARAALAAAEEQSRAADQARAVVAHARAERAKVEIEVFGAEASVASLTASVAKGRAYLVEAESIRAAVVRAASLREELAAHDAAVAAARARAAGAEAASERAAARVFAIERRLERAREALTGREAVAAAQLCLPNLEQAATGARAELERANADLEAVRDKHVASAAERIVALRCGLAAVVDDTQGRPAAIAADALAADDAAIHLAAELPVRSAAALVGKGEANARAAAAEAELAQARTVAARAGAMLAAEQDFEAAIREWTENGQDRAAADAERRAIGEAMAVAEAAADRARAALDATNFLATKAENLAKAESVAELRAGQLAEATATLERLRASLAALPPDADPPPPGNGAAAETAALAAAEIAARTAVEALGAAEATRRELDPQIAEVLATLERLTAELAAAPVAPDLPPAVDVGLARAEADSADRVLRDLAAEAARAEQRLEQAKAAAARAAELAEQRRALEVELADWTRLALDLGRDGIQSALVDAAGPELTALCNDLLRCHGTRYTVTVETKRAKADGKGETDECRVMVIDTVAGTEKEASEHSGGEQTLLGEAISLAITMLACKRAGVNDCTLVRDESSAALDPDNARAYVAMLRRAAAVVGARHVLIVSHDPLVQELCDHRIELPRKADKR
jgi:DNA repair exonuclease SbcCD ATPase subunit